LQKSGNNEKKNGVESFLLRGQKSRFGKIDRKRSL